MSKIDISIIKEKLKNRFFKYVKYDTTSDPNSKTYPSTETQKKFAKILKEELLKLGIKVYVDKYSYVIAEVPSNIGNKKNPSIGFFVHMDTSPQFSGKNVKPKLHKNYDGGKVRISDKYVLDTKDCPALKKVKGHDIITASGNSLLGADDKAGIAILVTVAEYLKNNPEIKHPTVKFIFTPDEEIGRGVDYLDVKKLNLYCGYTIDGDLEGSVEYENFNADMLKLKVYGKSVHPGSAKNQMANAVRIISDIIAIWPENMLPETTEGYDGFIMFDEIKGDVSYAETTAIIREHDMKRLKYMEKLLVKIIEEKRIKYPLAKIEYEFKQQYRNMKQIIDKHPDVIKKLLNALNNSGIKPIIKPIRGGTDGARLSFMGIPTPNIFTGGYNYHGPYEWISLDSMCKSFEVVVNLIKEWSR